MLKAFYLYIISDTKDNQQKRNNKHTKKQQNNSIFATTSNMIGLFNNKTKRILERLENGMKFSKNINEFRKQIINSYSDSKEKKNICIYFRIRLI